LNSLWHSQAKKFETYQERRDFLDENLVAYYDDIIDNLTSSNFEQEMTSRDLVIQKEAGKGGFGVVYEADHIVLGKRAVKKLAPIFADNIDKMKALRRFSREAQVLEKLHHKNIVRFFDAGVAGDYPFIIMEYVDGHNLNDFIKNNGTFNQCDALVIMKQLLDALAYAHDSGVVHRDIKPTNLMWNGTRVVVLDFGAGQWLERSLSTRITTATIGTSGYIADELLTDPELLHANLDCYSLGVVFHYLLTGRALNAGEPKHFLNQNGIDDEVMEVIIKAISPSGIRYKDGAEMLQAINELN